MALNNKALAIGGIACLSAIAYGLLQPKDSPTISERLGQEGYELISEKEKEDQIWRDRATLYKGNTDEWILKDLPKTSVNESGKEIKERCEEYKNKKVKVKDIGEEAYKKVTVLCTLNIGEYINLHLKEGETVITSDAEDWKDIYRRYEDEIEEKLQGTAKDKTEELKNFCTNIFKKQHSNENKEDWIKANLWCVKRLAEVENNIDFWYLL